MEVRLYPHGAQVRHSRYSEGPVLSFTAAEWNAFLAGVRLAEFDLPSAEAPA